MTITPALRAKATTIDANRQTPERGKPADKHTPAGLLQSLRCRDRGLLPRREPPPLDLIAAVDG